VISEIYYAAIAAGAPEEKARKAAEAMTVHQSAFRKLKANWPS
jgi:hypothetical protein